MSTAESRPDLPLAFRGYDRAAADAVLSALVQERDALRRQIDELVRELEERRGRAQALGDAFATAQQVAADLRAAAEADGEAVRSDARREATEIVREARIRADRLIAEVVAALEQHQRDTDEFVAGAQERLTVLVQELLSRLPGSAPPPAPAVDEGEGDAPAAGVVAA